MLFVGSHQTLLKVVPGSYHSHPQADRSYIAVPGRTSCWAEQTTFCLRLKFRSAPHSPLPDFVGLDLQARILQLLVAGACFVGCIFLRLLGAPMAECIRLLLYWPHASALVAYNGGTSPNATLPQRKIGRGGAQEGQPTIGWQKKLGTGAQPTPPTVPIYRSTQSRANTQIRSLQTVCS